MTNGRVITKQGKDRTLSFRSSADAFGVSLRIALACSFAESGGLDEKAVRFGTQTSKALVAIGNAGGPSAELQTIINAVWADISFGLGQRIVKYHWAGDQSQSAANVFNVMQITLANPDRDIHEMCSWLPAKLKQAEEGRRVDAEHFAEATGGDLELGALICYNAGHWPLPGDKYWVTHGANVANYRRGFAYADGIIAEMAATPGTPTVVLPDQPSQPEGSLPMDIATKADQMTWRRLDENGEPLEEPVLIDRLGNSGGAWSSRIEWDATDESGQPVRMAYRQYYLGGLLEYPVEVSESNPDGRDVSTFPEGTLNEQQLNQFRFGLA